MSKLSSLIVAVAAVTLLASSHCRAAESRDNQQISFRVLCTETRDEVISVLLPKGNSSRVEVPLFVGSFSELIKAKFADDKVSFYIKEKGSRLKLVAEGPLATGARQVFIVVPSQEKSGPIYQILAFNDDDGAFAMGTTRIINRSPFSVRMNLAGKEQTPIKSAEVAIYPLCTEVDEWNMYSAKIQFEMEKGKWQDVSTHSWKASDRKRDWVIIDYDVTTKAPVILMYQDIPPWMEVNLVPGRKAKKPKK
jgi:hypothetical protein